MSFKNTFTASPELEHKYFGAYRTTCETDTILIKNTLSIIERELLAFPDTPNHIRNRSCMENFILNLIRAIQIDEEILYRRDARAGARHFHGGAKLPLCTTAAILILRWAPGRTGLDPERPKDA